MKEGVVATDFGATGVKLRPRTENVSVLLILTLPHNTAMGFETAGYHTTPVGYKRCYG